MLCLFYWSVRPAWTWLIIRVWLLCTWGWVFWSCQMYSSARCTRTFFFFKALSFSLSALVWTGGMCSVPVGARGISAAGGLQGVGQPSTWLRRGGHASWLSECSVLRVLNPDTSITRQPGIHTLTLGLLLWLVLTVYVMSLKRCFYLSINWM